MKASYTVSITTNLRDRLKRYDMPAPLIQRNQFAHEIRVTVVDGFDPVPIGAISAEFLRADDVNVSLEGTCNGNVAIVTLPAECYAVPGKAVLTINCTVGSTVTCIGLITCNVAKTTGLQSIAPGALKPELADLLTMIHTIAASMPRDALTLHDDTTGENVTVSAAQLKQLLAMLN